MDIEIKKLIPNLLDDYLDFFDNTAFSDHKEWDDCYCMFYHINDEMKAHYEKTGEIDNRGNAISYINEGKLNGYLAYSDGKPVGWLNTDDKGAYFTLSRDKRPEIWDERGSKKTIIFVCFTIAPDMRGKGIATMLLDHALIEAKKEGYEIAEAYPMKGEFDCFRHYHGPIDMYKKQGFELYKELKDSYIVRKELIQ